MAYLTLTDVSLSNNSAVVTVNSAEQLGTIRPGDQFHLAGYLPVLVLSTDETARTINLKTDWAQGAVANVDGVIVASSADFRVATKAVVELRDSAMQWVGQLGALANDVTTVSVVLPDESTVSIPSIPKVILDATAAGSELLTRAQAVLEVLEDLPVLAEEVQVNVDDFIPKYELWTLNSPVFLNNYVAVNSAITDFNSTSLPAATQAASDATVAANALSGFPAQAQQINDNLVDFNPKYELWTLNGPVFLDNYVAVNGAITDFNNTSLPAATQAVVEANIARDETVQAKNEVVQIAGGTAPNALALGDETAEQWQHKINRVKRTTEHHIRSQTRLAKYITN